VYDTHRLSATVSLLTNFETDFS